MLMACLGEKDKVYIQLPYSSYTNKILSKVDDYSVMHNEMHYVLNWNNVKKYLAFDYTKETEFNKLTKREKVRALLGCNEFPTKYCRLDMFIYRCDQG